MNPSDFCPQSAVSAFDLCIEKVIDYFDNECNKQKIPVLRPDIANWVQRQIFDNTPLHAELFLLFFTNSVNRSGGPRLAKGWDWNSCSKALAGLFVFSNPVLFAGRYPPVGRCPSPDLRNDFADLAVAKRFIAGNVTYHETALRDVNNKKNGWVRMLCAVQEAGQLFAGIQRGAGHVVDDKSMMRALWGFDLAAISLQKLKVDDLWRATDKLTRVPEIGRQLALNFVKDAGHGHAFKPDTHTRKVAGRAFRQRQNEYDSNDRGERACVGACLAFAKVLASHGQWNPWTMSLAAVDRLMWLAAAGDLWVAAGKIPPLPKSPVEKDQRRKDIADILRSAVRPNQFGP